MSAALSALFVHTVTVQTYQGSGANGDVYAAPVEIQGFLDDSLVVTSESGGLQVQAKSVLYTDLSNAALFVPRSRVTANGETHTVSAAHRHDGGSSVLSAVSHLEVTLS